MGKIEKFIGKDWLAIARQSRPAVPASPAEPKVSAENLDGGCVLYRPAAWLRDCGGR